MKVIRVHQPGGPEAMVLDDLPTPDPGPGQALVKIEASGVNFIDIYQRSGAYQLPYPLSLGQEGAGTVQAVGPEVTTVRPGDQVTWTGVQGSYASEALIPADRLVPLPSALSFDDGAAAMLQGLTAHYLAKTTYPLKPGDTCLVHAAAGGVGLLLCQIAKMQGARVIGTCGTEAKAELARQAGADEVILYTKQDFEAEVKRLTDGRGIPVVYDSVGQDTFDKSLNCLRPRGYLVLYGQSSGPVAPVNPQTLNTKGSLFLTRPSLFHYTAERSELLERANEVLGWIVDGKLKLRVDRTYRLAEAGAAHRALAGRETTGKVLLKA